jgi:hypothetical protein
MRTYVKRVDIAVLAVSSVKHAAREPCSRLGAGTLQGLSEWVPCSARAAHDACAQSEGGDEPCTAPRAGRCRSRFARAALDGGVARQLRFIGNVRRGLPRRGPRARRGTRRRPRPLGLAARSLPRPVYADATERPCRLLERAFAFERGLRFGAGLRGRRDKEQCASLNECLRSHADNIGRRIVAGQRTAADISYAIDLANASTAQSIKTRSRLLTCRFGGYARCSGYGFGWKRMSTGTSSPRSTAG